MKILCKTQVVPHISQLDNKRLADVLSQEQPSQIIGAVTDEQGALYLIFIVDDNLPDHKLTNPDPILGLEEGELPHGV